MRSLTLGFALAAIAIGTVSAQAPTEKQPAPAVPSLDDAMIFAMLEKANSAEIELGELAARTGQSTEVRDLGKNFAAAHTTARQKARDLAVKIGVTPGKPVMDSTMKPADDMSKDASRDYAASLNKLKGTEFDVAFVAREIDHHTKMLDAVENKFLTAAQNPDLKALLTELKPSLQSHLDQARALEKKLALSQ